MRTFGFVRLAAKRLGRQVSKKEKPDTSAILYCTSRAAPLRSCPAVLKMLLFKERQGQAMSRHSVEKSLDARSLRMYPTRKCSLAVPGSLLVLQKRRATRPAGDRHGFQWVFE
ncbi:hypothetical protein CGZ80_26215 [Rhodopirellula sp. MGV]|nr:hypothetical protein CGZ80_26215 [Rhodopirellula sp. MGV]PNY38806.1 hypothetical protein C2E31_02580 [Rhodopirellula baltica]